MSNIETTLDPGIRKDLKNYFKRKNRSNLIYFAPKDIYPKNQKESEARQVRNNRWKLTTQLLKLMETSTIILDGFKIELYKKTTNSSIFIAKKLNPEKR